MGRRSRRTEEAAVERGGAGPVHVFGVRHHGPGSARSLLAALETLAPDRLLVEGPPDADEAIPLAAHDKMIPPVAILVYRPDVPERAVFYPFAEFSPEWRALRFALERGIPASFMDLPQAHRMALSEASAEDARATPAPDAGADGPAAPPSEGGPARPDAAGEPAGRGAGHETGAAAALEGLRGDPLRALAEAAGYDDGERWWEHVVETRTASRDIFAAISEAMAALRESAVPGSGGSSAPGPARAAEREEALREAWMRRTIRAAIREGRERIAVVCGAWHAPVLLEMPSASSDDALLRGLPRTKVAATWVPWTHGRLAFASGYGAGVDSPGWYEHLWRCGISGRDGRHSAIAWLTLAARALRAQDVDVSPAHVIEAARLADALAGLRGRHVPGLPELDEAIRSVFFFGDDLPMALVRERLIVAERLGAVPEEAPVVPLQKDLARLQTSLRLKPEAVERTIDLDLRKEVDLGRSQLLHRLGVLGIAWGRRVEVSGRKAGTFHEPWMLRWDPGLSVSIIEASAWGNTVEAAANAFAVDRARRLSDLSALTALVDAVVLADLRAASEFVMSRVDGEAALAADVGVLMDALPSLARILRYGSVRRSDAELVDRILSGLLARVCVGLPGACSSLDDDAAERMLGRILAVDAALAALESPEKRSSWIGVLSALADRSGLHGLIAGRAVRVLLDSKELSAEAARWRLGFALSRANDPAAAAAWVEGFLRGSGILLLHDESLWSVLDDWVSALGADPFRELLPLLRRTFATFPPAERRQLGARARRGGERSRGSASTRGKAAGDSTRARSVLPLLGRILGVPDESVRRIVEEEP